MRRTRAFLQGALTQNWGLKLLSLALAVLLWLFVVGQKSSEMTISIPLELTGVPDDLVILNRVPETVRARLSGPRTLLSSITPQQLSVILSLEGAQPGTATFENLASRIHLPKRIEVTYLSPSVVSLELDPKGVKRVPVKPRLRGDPVSGLKVVGVRVDPAEVEVEGAASVLKNIGEIPTEVVDVSGLEGSVSRPVELALPHPTLRRVSEQPEILHVLVREDVSRREFLGVPVRMQDPAWVAVPATADVRVEGPFRAVMRLSGAEVELVARWVGRQAPKGRVALVARLPEGIRMVGVNPRTVELRRRRTESR